ncbi:MAG: hypothetical protein F4Z21_08820 [Acidobacteria bacterium]|nr:hypothetical protein [Acidobacteriota bacterium]
MSRPTMELFNRTLSLATDLVMAPLQGLSPSISLLLLSAAMGILFLLAFRLTSNQEAIGRLRRRMAAHLLEFRLFQHSLGIQWSALSRMLLANLIYLRYAGRPMLLMLVPLGLVLIQLDQWYGYQPLKPDETALVSLKLSGEGDLTKVRLETDDGLELVGRPLRSPRSGEVNWSVRPQRQGTQLLTFLFDDRQVQKEIVTSDQALARVSAVTPSRDFWDVLQHPGAAPLPPDSFAERISVNYPARRIDLLGWETHWLVFLLIVSTLAALAFKRLLRVQI